jgi:Domain of unknown function (DUF5666)
MPTDFDDFDEFDEFDGRAGVRDDLDDFDDDFDDEEQPRLPWPQPPGTSPSPPGRGNRTARRAGLLAVTAVVAALAGFGVVAAALHDLASSTSPGASAGSSPSANASPSAGSALPGGGTQAQLPLPAGPGQRELLEIGGKVTAVSAKSITVGGPGQSVTAAVTATTKVTGRVSRIGGIKVGDFVAVLISGTNGKLTAESIQDPASMS